jgi:hypothetical protein
LPYLHRTIVHFDAVEVFGGLCCCVWLLEDDGGNATALATRSIGEENPLDSADSLSEVILFDTSEFGSAQQQMEREILSYRSPEKRKNEIQKTILR